MEGHSHHLFLESNNENRLRWRTSRSERAAAVEAGDRDAILMDTQDTQGTRDTQDSECTVTRDMGSGIVVYSQTY